jgi:hypothetical protein
MFYFLFYFHQFINNKGKLFKSWLASVQLSYLIQADSVILTCLVSIRLG